MHFEEVKTERNPTNNLNEGHIICIECSKAMNHPHYKHESQIWCHTLKLGIKTNDGEDAVILGLLPKNDVSTADKEYSYFQTRKVLANRKE